MVFAIVSVTLMTVDHRHHHLELVRSVLSAVVYPIQAAVDIPVQSTRSLVDGFISRTAIFEENEKLRRSNLLIQSRLEKYAELEAENRRLRGLLGSAEKVAEKVLIAELLAVDLDPFRRGILLNKGTADGVKLGQSLIDANGILGQVVHAGPLTSTGLLITDPSHALPVRINRTGLRGVARGVGPLNHLRLTHVPNNVDLQEGDLVVTSGLGGRFPAGYPVGTIVRIERDAGQPFAEVDVRPSANLDRNREVLLVSRTDEAAVFDTNWSVGDSLNQ